MSVDAGKIGAHIVGNMVAFTIVDGQRSTSVRGTLVRVEFEVNGDVFTWDGRPAGGVSIQLTVDLVGAGRVTFSVRSGMSVEVLS